MLVELSEVQPAAAGAHATKTRRRLTGQRLAAPSPGRSRREPLPTDRWDGYQGGATGTWARPRQSCQPGMETLVVVGSISSSGSRFGTKLQRQLVDGEQDLAERGVTGNQLVCPRRLGHWYDLFDDGLDLA